MKTTGAAGAGAASSGIIAAVEAERAKIAFAPDIHLMGTRIPSAHYTCRLAALILLARLGGVPKRRVRRPPDNPINAPISLATQPCHTLALGEIAGRRYLFTGIVPARNRVRGATAQSDLAEIFKPILADRLIFKLVNNGGKIRPEHF